MRLSAIAIVLAACGASRPTLGQQQNQCAQQPADAQAIEWRVFTLPAGCTPNVPPAAFPIRDEEAFRAAFPCARGRPIGIDFVSEQLALFEIPGAFGGTSDINWMARRGGVLVVRIVMPAQCGGAQEAPTARLIVLPRDAPRLYADVCTVGTCPDGPPRP
jgi:hypothetical protein